MTQLTFKIQKDAQTVLSYLTDTQKFVSVHPLIYKMKELNKNKYKVYESVKLGIFTYRFTYQCFCHGLDQVNYAFPFARRRQ